MDMYLLRVPTSRVEGLSSRQLADLVPWYDDDTFQPALQAGLIVLMEGTAELVEVLLTTGGGDAAGINPTSWDDQEMVGVIDAKRVAETVEALGAAPVEEWSTRYEDQLAELKSSWDEEWAAALRRDAADVVRLFRTAAAAGEAVVMRLHA